MLPSGNVHVFVNMASFVNTDESPAIETYYPVVKRIGGYADGSYRMPE
jgi:hypothetical protein